MPCLTSITVKLWTQHDLYLFCYRCLNICIQGIIWFHFKSSMIFWQFGNWTACMIVTGALIMCHAPLANSYIWSPSFWCQTPYVIFDLKYHSNIFHFYYYGICTKGIVVHSIRIQSLLGSLYQTYGFSLKYLPFSHWGNNFVLFFEHMFSTPVNNRHMINPMCAMVNWAVFIKWDSFRLNSFSHNV